MGKMIKEVIVVEGKDDIAAVKKAVDAEVIATGGFALPPSVMTRIQTAAEKRGVIIFTDPDFAGEKIRKQITSKISRAKHAFLPREEAMKESDIGIENASPEAIRAALEKARCETVDKRGEFSQKDLVEHQLIGWEGASERRNKLGRLLGIGYGNAKQFLNRLNHYGVTREEFQQAVKQLKE